MGSTGYAEKTIIFRGASMKNLKKKVQFRIKLKTAGEQSSFIIKTSGGAIVCPGIKFVDNTHISGYFIKGLKINGTEITTSGYQTVTGTFNGRVTISK